MRAIIFRCPQCGDSIKIVIGYIPFDVTIPCVRCGKYNRVAVALT